MGSSSSKQPAEECEDSANTQEQVDDASHSSSAISDNPEQLYAQMRNLMRVNRSSVVLLSNMVTPDDIDEFVEEDIRQECGKFGNVEEVVISCDHAAGSAKVFVRFSDPTEAEAARQSLDQRWFAGRQVSATIYDQVMFEHKDLSG